MYIYWESDYHSHLKKILKNQNWHLYCEADEWGNECLYLDIEDETYCICESEEWTSGRPNLENYHVGEFYSAVVREVFDRIQKKDNISMINLSEIQETVLESFWRDWQEKGYVED